MAYDWPQRIMTIRGINNTEAMLTVIWGRSKNSMFHWKRNSSRDLGTYNVAHNVYFSLRYCQQWIIMKKNWLESLWRRNRSIDQAIERLIRTQKSIILFTFCSKWRHHQSGGNRVNLELFILSFLRDHQRQWFAEYFVSNNLARWRTLFWNWSWLFQNDFTAILQYHYLIISLLSLVLCA